MSGCRRAHRAVGLDPLGIPYCASRVEMTAFASVDASRSATGQVIPVRLDTTLLAALGERADRDHVSRSAAIREAIRAYVG